MFLAGTAVLYLEGDIHVPVVAAASALVNYDLLLIGTGSVILVVILTFMIVSWSNARDARRPEEPDEESTP